MPYFVFKIGSDNDKPVLLDKFSSYKEAKALCYAKRKETTGDSVQFKLMFAKDEHAAKRLVGGKHKPSSPLEEWEA